MATAWTELQTEIVDTRIRERAVKHLRAAKVVLPTFAELANPATIPSSITAELDGVDANAPAPANLFRVHCWNDAGRKSRAAVPRYVDLPEALTGVKARILVAL